MSNKYNKISENMLFQHISDSDFSSMLTCLGAFERNYSKNETLLQVGDPIPFVGLVLEGSIQIIKSDYDGNEVIIAEISSGDTFAEVFACAEVSKSPVSILSITESHVLYFDYRKIISSCSSSCSFHQQLIANMLRVMAKKSLYLNKRIEIISKKTLREKILSYLYYESNGSKNIQISMNREELAKFLCADRSALSAELSNMKRDGILNYHKNNFELLE